MKKLYTILLFISLSLIFSGFLYSQEEIIEEETTTKVKKPDEKKQDEKKPELKVKEEKKEQLQLQDEGLKDDTTKEVNENMRYFKKDGYKEVFENSFEIVHKAVVKSIEQLGCMISQDKVTQTDQGLYKASIKSDFCVFTTGSDTTFKALKKYSVLLPLIRGGIWQNGRMQYKFKLEEQPDGKVKSLLTGELSGFEDHITSEVHFWQSNGKFETWMLEMVKRNIAELKAQAK